MRQSRSGPRQARGRCSPDLRALKGTAAAADPSCMGARIGFADVLCSKLADAPPPVAPGRQTAPRIASPSWVHRLEPLRVISAPFVHRAIRNRRLQRLRRAGSRWPIHARPRAVARWRARPLAARADRHRPSEPSRRQPDRRRNRRRRTQRLPAPRARDPPGPASGRRRRQSRAPRPHPARRHPSLGHLPGPHAPRLPDRSADFRPQPCHQPAHAGGHRLAIERAERDPQRTRVGHAERTARHHGDLVPLDQPPRQREGIELVRTRSNT